MKKIIILSAILVILASSCERTPEADFYVSSNVVELYNEIYFTNTSVNADSYNWDFGDGTYSSALNPIHSYQSPGRYMVTLEAYRGTNEVDQASMYIDIYTQELGFTVSSNSVDIYADIYFTVTSSFADSYLWDFGDGSISTAKNPYHYYDYPGQYLVTLRAYKGSQEFGPVSATIEVLSTTLDIEVLEYYDHYPVPEASIVLYTTQYDWDNETNRVYNMEWFTDANGIAIMYGMDPIVYYVDIWHASHNNYQLASEDMNNVKTLPLIQHQVNQYTFYVDYIGTVNRKEGRKVAQYKVVKIERKIPGKHTR